MRQYVKEFGNLDEINEWLGEHPGHFVSQLQVAYVEPAEPRMVTVFSVVDEDEVTPRGRPGSGELLTAKIKSVEFEPESGLVWVTINVGFPDRTISGDVRWEQRRVLLVTTDAR